VLVPTQFFGIVERLQHQTTQMRNLDYRDYVRILLPRPSPEEQTTIVEVMEGVVKAIRAAKKEVEAAQHLKVALLQQLFSRGLPGRSSGQYTSKWLTCPSHWDRTQLRADSKVEAGFTMGRDLRGRDTLSVPYLTVVNVLEDASTSMMSRPF